MQAIRNIAEVLTDLADRSKGEAAATTVTKGSKGTFTYIPWNVTARLLTEVFGVFGWSATIVASSYHGGIYTVDLDLEVRAKVGDETVSKHVPGRGVGTVPADKLEMADLHDTAAKAARSDALSTAAKMLGDAFGLYLYDKGDPARSTTAVTGSATGGGPRPSDKQMGVLRKNGYGDEQVAGMDFKTWKGVLDAIFGGETPAVAPATKKPVAAGAREEEFPF